MLCNVYMLSLKKRKKEINHPDVLSNQTFFFSVTYLGVNPVNVLNCEKSCFFLLLKIYFVCRDCTTVSKSSNFKYRQLRGFLFCFWCFAFVFFFFPKDFFWDVAEIIFTLLKGTKKSGFQKMCLDLSCIQYSSLFCAVSYQLLRNRHGRTVIFSFQ